MRRELVDLLRSGASKEARAQFKKDRVAYWFSALDRCGEGVADDFVAKP